MNMRKGIKLIEEVVGTGTPAQRGDRLIYNLKIFLNRGDEVPMNEIQSRSVPQKRHRIDGNYLFIDHTIVLGKRQTIAAVEQSLTGMKAGGYRRVKASPHLAYREKGIPGMIPGNATLLLEIWLREIVND